MDFNEVLFRRTLVKALRNQSDEDDNKGPEELVVTHERNGYLLWYCGETGLYPQIIAWTQHGRNDIIAYAAKLSLGEARAYAFERVVNFQVPSLEAQALEPVIEKKG